MHQSNSPELKLGDIILNRYVPNAMPEEREWARERPFRLELLLVRGGERVREERCGRSQAAPYPRFGSGRQLIPNR